LQAIAKKNVSTIDPRSIHERTFAKKNIRTFFEEKHFSQGQKYFKNLLVNSNGETGSLPETKLLCLFSSSLLEPGQQQQTSPRPSKSRPDVSAATGRAACKVDEEERSQ
jgi:hypothetical protein